MYISYSTQSSRKWTLTPEEEAFLNAVEEAVRQKRKKAVLLVTRMANGVLSVSTANAYLGKIKLQGKSTWMQYMVGLYNSKDVENATLDEYMQYIRYWVRSA